jgi:hypothetical protein
MQAPLIVIAETINSARILANQNERTAPQSGVYGSLAEALKDTLDLITGDWNKAQIVYDSILDGNTVDQALRLTRPAPQPDPERIVGYIAPEDAADGVMTPVQNWEPGAVFHGQPIPADWTVVREKDLASGNWHPTI